MGIRKRLIFIFIPNLIVGAAIAFYVVMSKTKSLKFAIIGTLGISVIIGGTLFKAIKEAEKEEKLQQKEKEEEEKNKNRK